MNINEYFLMKFNLTYREWINNLYEKYPEETVNLLQYKQLENFEEYCYQNNLKPEYNKTTL